MPQECLIVEHEPLGDDYEKYLNQLKNESGPIQNTGLQIVRARSAADAKECLAKREGNRPFDLMVLDLELPQRDVRGHADVKEGFGVLKFAQERGGARDTLIVSGYPEQINEARRLGVKNWVDKEKFQKEVFQNAVQDSLWQLARTDSAAVLDERARKLSPYFERSLIHHFGLCFSRALQNVDRATDAIGNELLERFGLDPERDSEDFLSQQLQEIRRALNTGKQNWGGLRTLLGLGGLSSPRSIDIASTVVDLKQQVRPCSIAKSAKLNIEDLPSVRVLSFNGDVEEILSEMVLGGLADLKDSWAMGATLTLSGEFDDDWVILTICDNLAPLRSEYISTIEAGTGVPCGIRFSRAWGLSVMQHVALHGGGRLSVETVGEGNTIRYRIPRARNG